jgi:hypothetical protein
VVLDNGERLGADVLLWGSGYRMSLSYLELPEYRTVATLDQLRARLGRWSPPPTTEPRLRRYDLDQ